MDDKKISYKQTLYVDTYANRPSTADDGQLMWVKDTKTTLYFDSQNAVWMPLARFVIKKGTTVIDGKTVGNTLIHTLEESTLNFYPTQVIVRAVNISGAAVKPTITVGTNSPNYDNIASGNVLNSITSLLGITTQPQTVSTSPALSAGTQIYVRVTGVPVATNYTFKVDVAGYYEV